MNKGKGNKKRKTKKIKHTIYQKGADGQKTKAKRWNFEREDKRKTRKQNRIKEKKDFKDRPLGTQKKKTTLKLQENNLCGALSKQKTKTQRKKITKPSKNNKNNKRKKRSSCMLANKPYFW